MRLKLPALLLLLILVFSFVLLRHWARRAVPDYDQDIVLENLVDEVRVTRDAHAVPTVYATNEADLYRAVGYVMAQDRLWQMDLLRRASTGRLAELFGEDFVETDMLLRSLRIPEQSARVMAGTDPVIVAALEAYADGVNQFMEHNRGKLPPEFALLGYRPELWEAVHSVNFTGFMAWQVGGEWSTELILQQLQQQLDEKKFMELVPGERMHDSYVHPGFMLPDMQSGLLEPSRKLQELGLEVFTGSNSWAVSGSRSSTGRPLFAHDMHLFLFAPGIWYQMQQVVEGELNVTGVVMPGQPFIIAGHNEHIAWGMTSVMVDDVDFYQETIHPDDPNQYFYMEEWHQMEIRQEWVHIRRRKPVQRNLRFTHRGPVVSDIRGHGPQAISMQWLGNGYGNELRSMYLLNRASNWEEFRHALSTFKGIAQNVNYADVEGNIGIQTAAGIPIRKGNGTFVVPGMDDTWDWQGLVPFEELPFTYNPPEGYVISANNRTVPDNYPYYISHWFDPPQRYDRIREMLLDKERLSIGDFRQMLGDRKSRLTQQMMPTLLEELGRMPSPTPTEKQAIGLLRQWDMVYLPQYAQPLIFEKFLQQFTRNLVLGSTGEELFQILLRDKMLVRNLLDRVWASRESAWLEHSSQDMGNFTYLVQKSFTETIQWIGQQLGENPEDWAWGEVHILTLGHPVGTVGMLDRIFRMNRGSYAPGGSFHTVCPYSFNPGDPFKIMHGASHRHIYSMANWDESLSVIPTGTSGIPASKYYCDQTEMYVNNEYRGDLFSEAKVREGARYEMWFRKP